MAPAETSMKAISEELKPSQEDRRLQEKPRPSGNQRDSSGCINRKPRTVPPSAEDVEAELRSSGLGAALLTAALYAYGNALVVGHLPKDPRVDPWLLMSSPAPTLLVVLAYVASVTWVGPRLMRHRRPLRAVRPLMVLYNAFQVAFSAWMFYEAGMSGWFGSYSFLCQPCDFSNSPEALRMVNVAIWYTFSKFVDFLDTFFFVLTKKFDHITLLHVSHHALMPLGLWYGVRTEPGGQTTFFGFLNAFVHIVMYSYYLLASMGPRLRPFLWWKKYLTTFQMVQFIVIFVHAVQTLVTGCPAGAPLMRIVLVLAVMFLLLFTDFYIKAYRQKAKRHVTRSLIRIPKYFLYLLGEGCTGKWHVDQWEESIEFSTGTTVVRTPMRFQDSAEGCQEIRSRPHNS